MAPRPASPLKAARTGELYLLWHFAFALLLEWQFRDDSLATLKLMTDVGGPAKSRRDRAAVVEALAAALSDDIHEPPPTAAMLEAATRWFCALRLPRNEEELWAGLIAAGPRQRGPNRGG
jgi:hypothetical protein